MNYKVLAYEPEEGSVYVLENGNIHHYLSPRPSARKMATDEAAVSHAIAELGYVKANWPFEKMAPLFRKIEQEQSIWLQKQVQQPPPSQLEASFLAQPAFVVKGLVKRAKADIEAETNLEHAIQVLKSVVKTHVVADDAALQNKLNQLLTQAKHTLGQQASEAYSEKFTALATTTAFSEDAAAELALWHQYADATLLTLPALEPAA